MENIFYFLFVTMIDSIKMNSYQEEDDAESIEAKMLISAKLLERMVSPVTLSSDTLLRHFDTNDQWDTYHHSASA